jgi:CRP-like cAMP-binding protein
MSDLLLIGPWERLGPVAGRFHAAGHAVLLAAEAAPALAQVEGRRFHLAVAEVASSAGLAAVTEVVRRAGCPWLALDGDALISEAYASGAVSVLPARADPELVEQAAMSLLARFGGQDAALAPRSPGANRRRRFRAGDSIPVGRGQVLLVEEGVLAKTALEADGGEILLGFVAAGSLALEPQEDLLAFSLSACTDAEIAALSWEEAMLLPRFPERLRDQLAWAQAWSAAQARPHLDDRLSGILELLARQFGRSHPQGVLVDFRVTHSQLAQAVGSTRSTVTRLLARLRRSGRLFVTGLGGGERWIVST